MVYYNKKSNLYLPQVGNELVVYERALKFQKESVGRSFLESFCEKSDHKLKDFEILIDE